MPSHTKQNSIKTPTKVVQGLTQSVAPTYAAEMNSYCDKRDDGMKICRGPFNVNCTTSKDP